MLTRRARVPRPLAWVGLVSYSVYLVHHLLIQVSGPLLTGWGERLPAAAEVPVVAGFLAVLAALSWLTHRFVEVPGQRFGRRWARCMDRRWGTDAPARARPAPKPGRAGVSASGGGASGGAAPGGVRRHEQVQAGEPQ
jgi:peptidoglycan/LPS O-acetylase OafA/YrhL